MNFRSLTLAEADVIIREIRRQGVRLAVLRAWVDFRMKPVEMLAFAERNRDMWDISRVTA